MASDTQLYRHLDVLSFQTFDMMGNLYDAFKLVKRSGQPNLFIEGESLRFINMRTTIPESAKKKYTPKDMQKYYQRFPE